MSFDRAETIGLARWWWTFILRGVLAILFGMLAFFAPSYGIAILVGLFAAWAIIDGVGNLIAGIRTREQDRSWWLEVLEGLVSIAAGVIAILLPEFAARVLVIMIAVWAILTGVIEIVMAVRLRRVIEGEAWMALSGIASILFGALLVLFPGTGALSLAWLIGAFAIAFGIFLMILGWRLRGIHALASR
jgi:uncharacterized membrane protein HdeD (DUF308 family)